MIILSWNCRGLAWAAATRALIGDIGPDIVFLFETKIPIDRVRKFLWSLGFYNLDFVNPWGKKAGLIVGWKIGVDLEITSKCNNMIYGLVFSNPVNEPWMISLVYGPPNRNNRGPFCNDVEKVEAFNGGWLCLGDFNHVFSQVDKKGDMPVATSSNGGSNAVIDKNGLIDLYFWEILILGLIRGRA